MGTRIKTVLTGFTQRLVEVSGEGFGFFGALASRLKRCSQWEWCGPERSGPPDVHEQADQHQRSQQELVQPQVRCHETSPFITVKGGYCTAWTPARIIRCVEVHDLLFQVYHNFVLPHASLRQALAKPIPTNGSGSAKVWRPCTPAMAAGLTDHVWSLQEVLCYRVPPWPQAQMA